MELIPSIVLRSIGLIFQRIPWIQKLGQRPSKDSLACIEVLSDEVVRVLGMNPGAMTLQGTNTYLIGSGRSRILLDTGEGKDEYVDVLKSAMEKVGCQRIEAIVLTHRHADHIGGIRQIHERFGWTKVYKMRSSSDAKNCLFAFEHLTDGQEIAVDEDLKIQVIYTPGHTDDHASIVLGDDILFSGDCILGCGSAVFEDYSEYMASLERLRRTCIERKIKYIFPGHGPIIKDPLEKIDEYIQHRQNRENQIIRVLENYKALRKPVSSLKICQCIYKNLKPILWISAQNNVLHHLEKLEKEVKVKRAWYDLWTLIDF